MSKYREIIRLISQGISQRDISESLRVSRNTVSLVYHKSKELGLTWPLDDKETESELREKLKPKKEKSASNRKMPDFEHVRKELLRNGVNKKLLWFEYCEDCRQSKEIPLMYSQFCYYVLQYERKRRATMHIPRKPGEQIEIDWAGDPAQITDPDTGKSIEVSIFVGVLSYSQYAYVEAFVNEKKRSWITAHVHMFDYFKGSAKILIPDNCKTAVNRTGWYTQELNTTYHEMAEHYSTAIIPARVKKPKDKPTVEGSVRIVSTWITAALRNEQFFSIEELNQAIRVKLEQYNQNPFQKKESSRKELYLSEELDRLTPLPTSHFELSEWKKYTVQFNYHVCVEKMNYSVPYTYLNYKVDVRVTDFVIEIFYNQERLTSHKRLYGRPGQYSTLVEHMPLDHQKFLQWNGDRFREWAVKIGPNTTRTIHALLTSGRVEQQQYKSCMGLLKLAEKYHPSLLEKACEKALSFTPIPSYKGIKNILLAGMKNSPLDSVESTETPTGTNFALTRGSRYYGGKKA